MQSVARALCGIGAVLGICLFLGSCGPSKSARAIAVATKWSRSNSNLVLRKVADVAAGQGAGLTSLETAEGTLERLEWAPEWEGNDYRGVSFLAKLGGIRAHVKVDVCLGKWMFGHLGKDYVDEVRIVSVRCRDRELIEGGGISVYENHYYLDLERQFKRDFRQAVNEGRYGDAIALAVKFAIDVLK